MKSLNELYAQNKVYYACNACGEINLPDEKDVFAQHTEDELPIRLRTLYEENWYEDLFFGKTYVAVVDDKECMLLEYMFDNSYQNDIFYSVTSNIPDDIHHQSFRIICDIAKDMEANLLPDGIEVAVGEDTDPDGHELQIIVPYEKRMHVMRGSGFIEALMEYDVYKRFSDAVAKQSSAKTKKVTKNIFLVVTTYSFTEEASVSPAFYSEEDAKHYLQDDSYSELKNDQEMKKSEIAFHMNADHTYASLSYVPACGNEGNQPDVTEWRIIEASVELTI